jgi:hypothetical protein
MEIAQIRYFFALCEARHFTRAARRCGISQPSLSNAIRRLEEEFGGRLFRFWADNSAFGARGDSLEVALELVPGDVGRVVSLIKASHSAMGFCTPRRI